MKTARHLMLDIETMDNGPEAAIIGIGARVFTLEGPGKGFEVFIDPELASRIGTVGADTISWWNKQEARDLVFGGKADPADAFHSFIQFCKQQKVEFVWANAPSFDCVILRHMAKQTGQQFPFHYRNERDCRTLFALGRAANVDCQDLWENPDRRAYVALDDATRQAEVVVRILRQILNSPEAYSDLGSDSHQFDPGCSAGLTDVTDAEIVPSQEPRGSSD